MREFKILSFALAFSLLVVIVCFAGVSIIAPPNHDGIEAYTKSEVQRVFREHLRFDVTVVQNKADQKKGLNHIVIGTVDNNPLLRRLVKKGFVKDIIQQQGYSICCAPNPKDNSHWILAILGADNRGALYGLRDLEHCYLKNFQVTNGKLEAKNFEVSDYPRIEYRGHWGWGVFIPDKKGWIENMSRWKLNELIEWDNYPPEKAKEYVDFAHSRGVRVVWGFGWGWVPQWNFDLPEGFDHGVGEGQSMCGSSQFNKDFFRREILKKVREVYAPTGCDGIYFQSFTEQAKCRCEKCSEKTMGEVLVEFVNFIVPEIKKEFPDLWISCGVHANFGNYDALKDLDSRCNILWENCDSGISVRGENEDFGYINKTIPYEGGFSGTCPADPPYTEESLKLWMESNKDKYTLRASIEAYYEYMEKMQDWGRNFLGKKSVNKHASCVTDHAVFCRRTPFMHLALAEAQWNPDLDTEEKVNGLVDFLGLQPQIEKWSAPVQHDALGKTIKLISKYSQKRPADGNNTLVDGKISLRDNVMEECWQGYKGNDLEAVVDLGKKQSIHSVSSAYLQRVKSGIFYPYQVEYAVSDNGTDFKTLGVVNCEVPTTINTKQKKAFFLQGLNYSGRYVRLKASIIKQLPEKYDKGQDPMIYVDEFMVNPSTTKMSVSVQHDAVYKPIELLSRYSPKYMGDSEGNTLVDGKVSMSGEPDEDCWQGYEGNDLEAVIDLGKLQTVHAVSSAYLQFTKANIFFPEEVKYELSENGTDFNTIGIIKCDVPVTDKKKQRKIFSIQGLDLLAKYVRIKALNIKEVPEMFETKGQKAFLFVDELMVNPLMIK